jgi:hypothetical protein
MGVLEPKELAKMSDKFKSTHQTSDWLGFKPWMLPQKSNNADHHRGLRCNF